MTRSSRRPLVRDYVILALALALTAQWVVVHSLTRAYLGTAWEALLPGLAIFGSAALLSWGAELAQLEISQALALAFLALVAVLPEYAVDMYLAWTAAKDPTYITFAAANMTGANRLLIGLGWPTVLFAYWAAKRKQQILLEPGDSWVVPKGSKHTYKILEAFTAVEATTPPAFAHGRDRT